MNVHYHKYYINVIQSPIGKIRLSANEIALLEVSLTGEKFCGTCQENKILLQARVELEKYFSGELSTFGVPISLSGTSFQVSIWKRLRQIPYGTRLSYSELARSIGNKNAARAAGSANRKNKLPIIIPCHRVIRKDGGIGGYSAGPRIKQLLIELEMKNKLSV